jgi:hypothetical protein
MFARGFARDKNLRLRIVNKHSIIQIVEGGGIVPDSPDEIQWHPAFCAATGLELHENIDDFAKTMGYALLYKGYGETVNKILSGGIQLCVRQ